MADISKKLTLLRGLYAKMPEGGGKKAVASKIAKLEASQPKEVVEVKEQVKEVKEVIKKPKAPKKTSKGKEMRHVFEKKVDGGKEVKVVMATSVDLAKEAMQESGFDFNRTISRGRSPKEGFVASERPKKTKETKRPTKATRDEMAKAAGMTPEKAEKVATKVASAKKRGRKPAKHNAYLFEMPMKTQEGKVKRKLITATSQESAQKQVGKNYTFIKELKSGEKAKTGIQPIKDFVAPPPKRRGRRPRPKTQAEMDRMSDLYSKLGKKVKGQKSKKSKVAKKPKSSKKPSKITDSSIEFTALKKLAEEVTDLTEQLSFRVQVLNGQIEKFRNYEEKFAEGGEVKDKYAVGVRLFTEDEDEDEDDDSIGYGYIHIYASSPKEALAEAKRLSQSDEYVNIMEDTTMPTWYGWDEEYSWEINDDDDENPYLQMAKGGSTYAEGGGVSIDWEIDVYINFEDTGWIETINVVAKDKKEAIKKAKELATETVSMGNQDEQDATFRVDSIKSSTTNWKRYKDYAEGGIMADGRLELGSSNGVGGNKNKTYKLIKDDRDSDGEPYYEVVEHPSDLVMAQGDDFVEVNNMYKLFTGKQ